MTGHALSQYSHSDGPHHHEHHHPSIPTPSAPHGYTRSRCTHRNTDPVPNRNANGSHAISDSINKTTPLQNGVVFISYEFIYLRAGKSAWKPGLAGTGHL